MSDVTLLSQFDPTKLGTPCLNSLYNQAFLLHTVLSTIKDKYSFALDGFRGTIRSAFNSCTQAQLIGVVPLSLTLAHLRSGRAFASLGMTPPAFPCRYEDRARSLVGTRTKPL
jgi:hypothetical protein